MICVYNMSFVVTGDFRESELGFILYMEEFYVKNCAGRADV